MAKVYADRVKETSTTTGTGTYDLAGAATGYQTFVAGVGDTNTCAYVATDGTDWEVGVGTVTDAATDTLSRDTIQASSNAGSAVNWSAGTRNISLPWAANEASNTLKANATDTLEVGYSATPYSAGTKSSGTYTPDEADGNFQYAVNGGAHTLAPPTNNCTIVIQYTNNGSAGTITTSGFTIVTGDTISTTSGDDFFFFITKCNGFSSLNVQALQ
jgi:hypothetical protein